MKVSAKGRYAVRSVINLTNSGNSMKSVREIAEEESISSDFLEKIFAKLKKHKIISSVRGAHGGFTLNKPPVEISVYDVLYAVGEDFTPTPCSSEKCGKECDISYFWSMTKDYVTDYFRKITISDIINREIKF